jgi:hypothetical protein
MRTLLIGLAAVGGTAAVVLRLAQRRWQRAGAELQQQLLAAAPSTDGPGFDATALHGVPAPAACYLRQVLRAGQAPIRRARIAWRGEFNMGRPGADRWRPFEATQLNAIEPPGFVWDARIAMAPGLPVLVRDAFTAGHGLMEGRIAGLIPVLHRAGTPQIAAAALQRHLGEAIWFPTALLPGRRLRWEPIDDTRARALLQAGNISASVEFQFGADGLVQFAFVPDRWFDNGHDAPSLQPWRARVLGWREMNGILVPAQAVAEWLLPGGAYAYWRGAPVSVRYETAPP